MKVAFPRSAALVSVCRQAGLRLTAYRAGRAERIEGAEGKIKETGTRSAGFLKLLLSAHWLDGPRAAPRFSMPRAAILCKDLAFLGFDRHHGRRTPDFLEFWPGAHP
ncbi:hypothetical protein [Hyphomicrobium sp.]|uniref:hypothetical protein n=1 Tax=Hyphomicrobium sp. TaxID=82 RepID=UPI002FE21335